MLFFNCSYKFECLNGIQLQLKMANVPCPDIDHTKKWVAKKTKNLLQPLQLLVTVFSCHCGLGPCPARRFLRLHGLYEAIFALAAINVLFQLHRHELLHRLVCVKVLTAIGNSSLLEHEAVIVPVAFTDGHGARHPNSATDSAKEILSTFTICEGD